MRIADASESEGVESKRRGARYPVTSDAAPSSRDGRPRGGNGRSASSRKRRDVQDAVVLVPPIRVMSVAEDPRVKGRVRVRCQAQGESVTLVIGASGVRAFNVRTGMTLDTVGWAALSREARVVHAQDAALRMLSTSRRSRRDLEVRLRRREMDQSIIGDALGRLDSIGLLNDDEFALAEASAQLRNAARSTGAVKRRLRQRGVSGEVADAAVAAAVDTEGVDDAARCEAAAEKRVRQLRSFDKTTAQRRLVGFLMRRGFAGDLVFAAARRAMVGWGQGGVDAADDVESPDDDE
jgi:regulatory protein